MSDKELLKLAAKAAAYRIEEAGVGDERKLYLSGEMNPWNPLRDDGDALRLAVKLRIEIDPWSHSERVTAWNHLRGMISLTDKPSVIVVAHHREPRGDDEYAATRRAIVRAAAEIGKSLP